MADITNLPKRKYAKDTVEAVKRRNNARTERKPAGTISFTADTKQEVEQIQTLFNRVKSFLGEGKSSFVSSKVALEAVLQFFVARNIDLAADRVEDDAGQSNFADCSFSLCEEIATSKQQLFVCAESSVDKLTEQIQQHSCLCQRPLQRTELKMLGHVAMVTLQCDKGHKLLWPTIWGPSTWLTADWRTAISFKAFYLTSTSVW